MLTGEAQSSSTTTDGGQVHAAQSYAKMLSPFYRQKLEENRFVFTDAAGHAVQREQYRKDTANTIRVRWWTQVYYTITNSDVLTFDSLLFLQDSTPPLEFRVPVVAHPFFHPKDVPALTEVIGEQNCKVYGYYDDQSGTWTITSLPIKIKTHTDTLQLRSRDVTICSELNLNHARGSLSKKRTLSLIGISEHEVGETVRKKASVTELHGLVLVFQCIFWWCLTARFKGMKVTMMTVVLPPRARLLSRPLELMSKLIDKVQTNLL